MARRDREAVQASMLRATHSGNSAYVSGMERDVLRRFRVAQTCGCCAKPPVGKLRTVKRPEGRAPAQITVAELTHTGQWPMRKAVSHAAPAIIGFLTSLRNRPGGVRVFLVILCVLLTSARVSGSPG